MQKTESLIRKCVHIPQKTCSKIKRLKLLRRFKNIFLNFSPFIDSIEQQIPVPFDNNKE